MRSNNSRFKYMIILGVAISFLLDFIVKGTPEERNKFLDVFLSIIITILVWEGNLRIDHWMNLKFPWVSSPLKRILVHLPISLFFSALIIYLSMVGFNKYVCSLPHGTKNAFMGAALIIGVIISIMILSIEISTQFFQQWKASLLEVEKYKTESTQAQLQNLKNQINPHFLFNNMSVLSSLVYKDQDKAVDFINQLSKVYRYLLDNKDEELTTLENELTFINSYIYLLQIRFDTNIHFDIQISKEYQSKFLPPMALQLLIENAIKHNEISSELPLTIFIKTKEHQLIISNNLQLRSNYPEDNNCKTGIQNIKDRYHYFTDREVLISKSAKLFTVQIPLLQAK